MNAGGHRIGSPEQNQSCVVKLLNRHPDGSPMDRGETIAPGGGTDRGIQTRRAKRVKKALGQSIALHETHRPGVAVRHDSLRISGGDLRELCRDLRDRDLPRDRLKLPGSLGPDPTKGLGQSIRMVSSLRITRDFRA